MRDMRIENIILIFDKLKHCNYLFEFTLGYRYMMAKRAEYCICVLGNFIIDLCSNITIVQRLKVLKPNPSGYIVQCKRLSVSVFNKAVFTYAILLQVTDSFITITCLLFYFYVFLHKILEFFYFNLLKSYSFYHTKFKCNILYISFSICLPLHGGH